MGRTAHARRKVVAIRGRSTVSDHLSELINYGGQMLPRGTVYNLLRETARAQGHSKTEANVLADRWMQGHDLRHGNPDESAPVDAAAIASTFTSNLALTTDPAFEEGDAETRAALITAHGNGSVAPAPPPAMAHNPGYGKDFLVAAFSPREGGDRRFYSEGVSSFSTRAAAKKYFDQLVRNGYPVVLSHDGVLLKTSGIGLDDALRHGAPGIILRRRSNPPEPGDAPATSPALATAMGGGQPQPPAPAHNGKGTSTSTSTDVRSPTSTDVRSPTRTATSTEAYTAGNVTVTGGAGAGANTRVIIRRNPRRDDTPYAKYNYISNPEAEAAELYSKFHGYAPEHVETFEEEVHYHSNLAQLGSLVSLEVETESGYTCTIKFPKAGTRNEVRLASSEDGSSLYLIGGDQTLDLAALHMSARKDRKDLMVIGRVKQTEYFTTKEQDGMTPTIYFHRSREGLTADGTKHTIVADVDPVLLYDTKSKLISLAGGQYTVESVGIVG